MSERASRGTAISGRGPGQGASPAVAGARTVLPESAAGQPPYEFLHDAPADSVPAEKSLGEGHKLAPGQSAPTVKVDQLWNSLTRWILNGPKSPLRSFIFSSFQKRHNRCNRACTPGPVWAIPLPFSDVAPKFDQPDAALMRSLNLMVLVLNWLHLGQPGKAPFYYSADAPLTGEQWGVVKRLKRLAQHWADAEPVTAAEMGRTAGKVETLEAQVAALTRWAQKLDARHSSGSASCAQRPAKKEHLLKKAETLLSEVQLAKEIEADRLSFGGRPAFDPAQFLEPSTREVYTSPLKFAAQLHEVYEDPPRVQVRGKRSEILKLMKKLDDTNRLKFFRPDEVRDHCRSGLFALMKNVSTDRLIMDSRPANMLEPALNSYTQTMASFVPLLDVFLQPENQLIAAGEDLKDFYYYYKVSEERARRNAIACEFRVEEVKNFAAFKHMANPPTAGYVVPALDTMAMGDVNAVEFGQQSHVLLASTLGLKCQDLLTLRGKHPRQDWAVGIVIDDFVVVEQVPKTEPDSGISSEIADAMTQVYEAVGLVPNSKKRFRVQSSAKFWGISLDGDAGVLRPQLERVLPIAFVTAKLARLGFGNRKLLEILAGSWTAILQCRRRGMCLLEEIFQHIQAHDYDEIFELSPSLVSELFSLVTRSPLFCTDLRASIETEFSLVDASGEWKAEVVTSLPEELAKELYRQKLTKSTWSRLLSPLRALLRLHGRLPPEEEVPEGEQPLRAHPVWTAIARSFKFATAVRRRVRRRAHINISELEALLEAEERKARKSPNSRLLVGSDSQVTLGCLVKGRASSASLNKCLRRALPIVFGYNVYTASQ